MMATKPAAGSGSAVLQKQVADLNRQLVTLRDENTTLREKAGNNISRQPASTNPEAEQNYQDAKAALTAGNLESSLEKFKAAQLLEPDNSRYNVDYSIALAQAHEYAEASDLLRRYLQRNPADREAYGQLGKIYLLNDQTEMAAQALSRAIPIGTLNNYATALKKAGKNEDAENIFKMALKLNPNDSEVLFNLGNLYNATERLELARNSYLQAIQVKPDFAEAYYNLGLIYSKLNDRAKAVTYLEKFLQLSPNARNADTIRAYVEKLKA
jgi:Flp pilus assembly protein TadD